MVKEDWHKRLCCQEYFRLNIRNSNGAGRIKGSHGNYPAVVLKCLNDESFVNPPFNKNKKLRPLITANREKKLFIQLKVLLMHPPFLLQSLLI